MYPTDLNRQNIFIEKKRNEECVGCLRDLKLKEFRGYCLLYYIEPTLRFSFIHKNHANQFKDSDLLVKTLLFNERRIKFLPSQYLFSKAVVPGNVQLAYSA